MIYTGGIVGLFRPNRKELEDTINGHNAHGYRLRHVLPARPSLFHSFVALLALAITLGIWTQERGETLIFERSGT